jgi:hypothetical protein
MTTERLADLTLVWDGRGSVCRQEAGLNPQDFPVGVDIWWFQLTPAAEVLATPHRRWPHADGIPGTGRSRRSGPAVDQRSSLGRG